MSAVTERREPGSHTTVSCDAPLAFEKKVKSKIKRFEAPQPLAPLADTHAHLTSFWEKQPDEVLARAQRAQVRLLVTLYDPIGDDTIDLESFQAMFRSWSDKVRSGGLRMRYLAGVHPYGAARYSDDTHAEIACALDDPACAGIGEIGLDYHFDADDEIEAAPHDVQLACMARQLELALERNVPVELHLRNDCRDLARTAHEDAYRLLCEKGIPGAGCVLHCFGEDRATMERFCDLGCHIAYGGAATFKRNEQVREAFAATPLDRVLFETDCPYMAPDPIRGLECEPAVIAFTADALARDRAERTGERPEDIERAAWENALRLFG